MKNKAKITLFKKVIPSFYGLYFLFVFFIFVLSIVGEALAGQLWIAFFGETKGSGLFSAIYSFPVVIAIYFYGKHLEKVSKEDDEFEEMVQKGTEAWKDVPNATEWVEDLRGNSKENNISPSIIDTNPKKYELDEKGYVKNPELDENGFLK